MFPLLRNPTPMFQQTLLLCNYSTFPSFSLLILSDILEVFCVDNSFLILSFPFRLRNIVHFFHICYFVSLVQSFKTWQCHYFLCFPFVSFFLYCIVSFLGLMLDDYFELAVLFHLNFEGHMDLQSLIFII